ncbi:hypothetical protein R1flu_008874 [Riccia fluitans]|uniref:Uncharacterized protein n=1 Tax=Riccia fluitans TaxID=41844 RepID=A0ABD1Z3H7_9MARC
MQAEATPATVFFSMIGNSTIVRREEEKIERLVLQRMDGNEVTVTRALIRRAFGITVEGIQSERHGVLYHLDDDTVPRSGGEGSTGLPPNFEG